MSPPVLTVHMSTAGFGGALVRGIRVDLRYLHDVWMGAVFPRQRLGAHNVLGRWRPQTTTGKVTYWGWYALGGPVVFLLYPFVLFGFMIRFYARGLGSTARRIGMLGVVLLVALAWGSLATVAFLQLPQDSFIAVAAAAGVATISAALAFATARVGGRGTTVLFAYPFAMTALFLPPVVAALVTPMLEPYVLDPSYDFAVWLLNNPLAVGGINDFLWDNFTLEGAAYAGMWIGIAFPVGWLLGILVTLADLVRPKRGSPGQQGTGGSSADD